MAVCFIYNCLRFVTTSPAMRFLTRSARCLVKSIESNDDWYAVDGSHNVFFFSPSRSSRTLRAAVFRRLYVCCCFLCVTETHCGSCLRNENIRSNFFSCFFFRSWKGKGNEIRCFIHYWGEIKMKEIFSNACTMFACCIWTTERCVLLGCCDSTWSDLTGIWCHHRFDSVAPIQLTVSAHETSMRILTSLCARVCTMRCLCRTEGVQ